MWESIRAKWSELRTEHKVLAIAVGVIVLIGLVALVTGQEVEAAALAHVGLGVRG